MNKWNIFHQMKILYPLNSKVVDYYLQQAAAMPDLVNVPFL
jgi:hypothetical protein